MTAASGHDPHTVDGDATDEDGRLAGVRDITPRTGSGASMSLRAIIESHGQHTGQFEYQAPAAEQARPLACRNAPAMVMSSP